jgi:hypothetical protein
VELPFPAKKNFAISLADFDLPWRKDELFTSQLESMRGLRKPLVPASGRNGYLLHFLHGQADALSQNGKAESGTPLQTHHPYNDPAGGSPYPDSSSPRRHAMSAAHAFPNLALPYVWAVAETTPSQPRLRPRPLSGAAFYRKHTEALLRRYMRVSLDVGRLPSILSRTVVRGRATCSRIRNFEDAVIFVIDVERCLKRLDMPSQELVARIALQEYTQVETAELTGQSARSIFRKYGESLDQLTTIFLEATLLNVDDSYHCQEGETSR